MDTTAEILRLEAEAELVFGNQAASFLERLIGENPLFAHLHESPNTHFVVFDLTSIGRASQHRGGTRFQLSKNGVASALPSLISKPIHVTSNFEGHFEDGVPPKSIGTFLGGIIVDNPDGSQTLRAIGTLWDHDFPEEIARIKAEAATLGASYEIMFPPTSALKVGDDGSNSLVEIAQWQFSGGAILKRTAAAHPETCILHATNTDLVESLELDAETKSTMQSVIVSKDKFKSSSEARSWVAKHNFKSDKIDETESSYRFRQFDPSECQRDSFRTISITDGVSGVICRKAAAASAESDVDSDDPLLAEMSTEERNKLSDSEFAYVKEVKNERTGKPRTIRRFPIHDEAHRKNAWARINQEQVGEDLSDAEKNAIRDRIINRAKREGDAWAKDYRKSGGRWVTTKGGRTMAKYTGIPDDLESVVDGLIAAALEKVNAAGERAEVERRLADATAQMDKMKKTCEEDQAAMKKMAEQVEGLTKQLAEKDAVLAEAIAAKEAAETAVAERDTKLAEIDLSQKAEAEWVKIAAQYHIPADTKVKAERMPLVRKLVAGKEPLTLDEFTKLTAGGKQEARVPLHAVNGDRVVDQEAIKKQFPAITPNYR